MHALCCAWYCTCLSYTAVGVTVHDSVLPRVVLLCMILLYRGRCFRTWLSYAAVGVTLHGSLIPRSVLPYMLVIYRGPQDRRRAELQRAHVEVGEGVHHQGDLPADGKVPYARLPQSRQEDVSVFDTLQRSLLFVGLLLFVI